jgi:DNA polymerase-3 subunit delta'
MNIHASNAFLKLLEEPPQDSYFILIAEESEVLLPTLLSRCQHISLGPIQAEALKEVIPAKYENSKQMVTLADGDYSRLQLLLQENQNTQHELLLVNALRKAFKARGNKAIVQDLMNWSRDVAALGREEQKAFLSFGIQFFRDAFLLNYKLDNIVYFQPNTDFDLKKLAPFVNNTNILDLIALFENTHYHILRNGSAKMLFSNLALKLTRLINHSKS